MAKFKAADLVLYGGAGYLLFTQSGRATLARFVPQLAGPLASLPALGSGGSMPALPGRTGSGAGYASTGGTTSAKPSAPSASQPHDASAWTAFKDGDGGGGPGSTGQVWVLNAANGTWRYVSSPAEFGQYGIAGDGSNIQFVAPGAGGLWFAVTANQAPAVAEAFIRSDSPDGTGINGGWPNALSQGAAAQNGLVAGFRAGQVKPNNVHGAALLKAFGAL